MALRERRCKMAPPAPAVLRARFSRGQDTPGSRLRSLIENHAYDFDLRARAEKIVDEWKAAGVSRPPANDAAAASSDLRDARVFPFRRNLPRRARGTRRPDVRTFF